MKVNATFNWDKSVKRQIEQMPDRTVYAIARSTLDLVGSMQVTPYGKERQGGHTHMEQTMYSAGVQKDSDGYYIGNHTDYASYVYKMPQSTNWTRKSSKAQWFEYVWKLRGESITNECIARYKL